MKVQILRAGTIVLVRPGGQLSLLYDSFLILHVFKARRLEWTLDITGHDS